LSSLAPSRNRFGGLVHRFSRIDASRSQWQQAHAMSAVSIVAAPRACAVTQQSLQPTAPASEPKQAWSAPASSVGTPPSAFVSHPSKQSTRSATQSGSFEHAARTGPLQTPLRTSLVQTSQGSPAVIDARGIAQYSLVHCVGQAGVHATPPLPLPELLLPLEELPLVPPLLLPEPELLLPPPSPEFFVELLEQPLP
jgi:hypothetical protein